MQRDLVAELTGRPSREDRRVGKGLLVFFLLAAPAAWFLQTVASYGAVSIVCQGARPLVPVTAGEAAALWWIVLAVNVVAGALAVAAVLAAAVVWRRQDPEQPGGTAGLAEPGEGGGRFLASWGIVGSACFALGILFSTIAIALVPLCAS